MYPFCTLRRLTRQRAEPSESRCSLAVMNEERSPAKPGPGTKKPIVKNPSTPGVQKPGNKPDGRNDDRIVERRQRRSRGRELASDPTEVRRLLLRKRPGRRRSALRLARGRRLLRHHLSDGQEVCVPLGSEVSFGREPGTPRMAVRAIRR